jgi:aminoacrylate hydrolase
VSFWDVHESERPDAPTVLLSSGLGGTAGYWAPQLAALKQRYRIVTYDQAGTGRNRRDLPDDHSIAAMADEIIAVMQATKTDKAHVVGHALGGLAGLDLAIRHPTACARSPWSTAGQKRMRTRSAASTCA